MNVWSLVLKEGGHNYNTWSAQMPAVLEWLGTRLSWVGGATLGA